MMIKKLSIYFSFFLLSTSIMCVGCYEEVDGCLDVDATNYDVNADNDCDNCCILPRLELLMSYINAGKSFDSTRDTIKTDLGAFIIEDFHIFLSDISMINEMGEAIPWEDEIDIYNNGQIVNVIEDDFKYFSRSKFRNNLNGLRFNGIVNAIQFKVGLGQTINFYNKDSVDVVSDLSSAPDDVYINQSEGFQFFNFEFRDTTGNQVIIAESNVYPLIEVTVGIEALEIIQGFNVSVNLSLDFKTIMDGIDLTLMDNEGIKSRLKSNLALAFGER